MRKLIVTLCIAGAALTSGVAGARQPSEACSTGEVPTSATPLGVGVRQAGDPYQEPTSVYVCAAGPIAPGAVRVRSEASGTTHVIVDGDDSNSVRPCTDGYVAARAGADGARLYRSGDGDHTFTARERTPQEFASGALADCAGVRS